MPRFDCLRAAEPLRELVGNVAGIQIREDEDIGLTCDRALLFYFLFRHVRHKRRIALKLAIDEKTRLALTRNGKRLAHFVDACMLCAAFGRK